VGSRLGVYALGGIGPAQAAACLAAGASGVAVMGVVMRAEDPSAVVRSLCREMAGGVSATTAGRGDG
jgi:thiamine-phosphate pyrophosphorylase